MTEHRSERRRSTRFRRHDIVAAKVRPGRPVAIVDVSEGGALIETVHRLLPGTCVELHMETTERSATLRGRVSRCTVARVHASSLSYRGAIVFDGHLPWFADDDAAGYLVHTSEKRSGNAFRADATPQVL
jgi:hypothetical protein